MFKPKKTDQQNNCSNWWAPVWKGLIIDGEARHYQAMGSALWLYLYFLVTLDRKTGQLFRKTATIATDMGVKKRTVRRWLNILKQNGYVKTDNTGRYLQIRVVNWKPASDGQKCVYQSDTSLPIRSAKYCQPDLASKTANLASFSQKSKTAADPNDIPIKKIYNNDTIEDKKIFKSVDSFKSHPETKQKLLALDLAESLNDRKNLALYISYAKRYPESFLRQILGEVKELPREKIKKSKGALFNYLVQKYDRR